MKINKYKQPTVVKLTKSLVPCTFTVVKEKGKLRGKIEGYGYILFRPYDTYEEGNIYWTREAVEVRKGLFTPDGVALLQGTYQQQLKCGSSEYKLVYQPMQD